MKHDLDVIVVGGGHAGCEAAHAAARMGASVGLVTLRATDLGTLSCNPAVGGVGKGHLVREIDAMGGVIGIAADRSGIHFRLLNRSKGPAVRGPRVQVARREYSAVMTALLREEASIEVIEGEVADLVVEGGLVRGVQLAGGETVAAPAVVLTTGTFLGGVMHRGEDRRAGGRAGAAAVTLLGDRLRARGIKTGRLKTGTPPRLDGTTIDWSLVEGQPGDEVPTFLSSRTERPALPQVSCGITHTNEAVHAIVREFIPNTARARGLLDGAGPRYCPSLEDKVSQFAGKSAHQVFLEPECTEDDLIYPNGLSTSLPVAAQEAFIRAIPSLREARIVRPGYAIEYDYVDPRSLFRSLAFEGMEGLFLAGQINGTTGYEEAAAQGLVAGVNAVLYAKGSGSHVFDRTTSYLGVLVDDLVTRGVSEPYRMFTSRAEERLTLRPDNAVERMGPIAEDLGCATATTVEVRRRRSVEWDDVKTRAMGEKLAGQSRQSLGLSSGVRARSVFDLLAIPTVPLEAVVAVSALLGDEDLPTLSRIRAATMYRGYGDRERRNVAAAFRGNGTRIPRDFRYDTVGALSNEARRALDRARPETLVEAANLEGVTPAATIALAAALR